MNATFQDLDNPVWCALSGSHHALGAVGASAGFYDPHVAPFAGLRVTTRTAFDELASLTGPERQVAFCTPEALSLPPGWRPIETETLEQFICLNAKSPRQGDDTLVDLGPADVAAMLALVQETQPGPFSSGTIRLGRYIGVRAADSGALAAMAGHRLRAACAVEISAVCTAASHRGRGLAGRLMQTLAAEALEQELVPFLHVRSSNASAIRLYEALGFRRRRTMNLTIAQTPAS